MIHQLIQRLLQKRGIKDTINLSVDEKKTYDEWQRVLDKDELDLEDIKKFCKSQIDVIEAKWADYNYDQAKKNELQPYHTIWNMILKAMESPKVAREALEKHLTQLLQQ